MLQQNQVGRLFGKYVSRNILSMIGLSCYILADTYFIAAGMGADGVAALNLALPAYTLLSALTMLVGMGAATRYAILRGQGQEQAANTVFTHALMLSLLLGGLISLFGLCGTEKLCALLGADATLLPLTIPYLRTELLFAPAFFLSQIFTCFIRNDERPGLAMAAMLCGSASNVVLDYLFIFPLGWGMFGAAFATCLAPLISMLVLSIHWLQKRHRFHLRKTALKLSLLRQYLPLGLPSFINESSSGLVILLFNMVILRLSGNIGVAAYGIIANLALIVIAIFTGIAQGVQPIISHGLGAGRQQIIRKTRQYAIVLALAIGAALYAVALLLPGPIVAAFNSENNQVLAALAVPGLRIYAASFLLAGFNIINSACFAAMDQPRQSFLISLSRGVVMSVVAILILPRLLGMSGVWLSIPAAELLTAGLSLALLLRSGKSARAALPAPPQNRRKEAKA